MAVRLTEHKIEIYEDTRGSLLCSHSKPFTDVEHNQSTLSREVGLFAYTWVVVFTVR